VQLALLVDCDALVDYLRQVDHLFSEFDLFAPNVTVHVELFVVFALIDQLDLLDALLFNF